VPNIAVDEVFRIGGYVFSRSSVGVKAQGVPYSGFAEINGEESREGEYLWGQRSDGTPLGITSGLYVPGPLTFKTAVDTGEQLCQQLGTQGLGSFGNVLWTLILEIFENPALPAVSIMWQKVKIEKRKIGIPTDATPLMYEFECKHQGMQVVAEGLGLLGLPTVLANQAGITVPSL
jgi:hypothetical protein